MPETIDRTLDALAERYDLALPMGDLFYSSAEKALLSDTTTGGYAGTENVGDTPCYHLAFQDIGVDWELWLPVQGEPLPKRLKVVQNEAHRPAGDRPDVHGSWNLAPQSPTPRSCRTCRRTTRASPSCSGPRRSRDARPSRRAASGAELAGRAG